MGEDRVTAIANKLISHYIPEWKFALNNRVGAIGVCDHRNETIFMSRKYLSELNHAQVEQVILHEIAHALTPGEKHGPVWKRVARRIGVENPSAKMEGVYKAPGKWFMHCEPCNHTYGKSYHTRHAVIKRRCCHMCKGSLVYKEK